MSELPNILLKLVPLESSLVAYCLARNQTPKPRSTLRIPKMSSNCAVHIARPPRPARQPRWRICGFCDYYPASEFGGWCCPYCVRECLASRARTEQKRREQAARELAEQEAARIRAEQRKQEFDQMVANSARKSGISFADVLKNKK